MKVMENYQDLIYNHAERAVALGNFDGIHLGHQALLRTLVKESRIRKLESTVYTFRNHPGTVLNTRRKQTYPYRITPIPLKIKILEKLGVQTLFLDDFTEKTMNLNPESFVRTILVDLMKVKLVVVGEDFRFGKSASGDVLLLQQMAHTHDYEAIIVPPVYHERIKISSTLIRQELEKGNMERVTELLGRPFVMYNRIARGYGRGKKLGYPTANLILEDQQMVPAEGVYATQVKIDDQLFFGATSVGRNPTFGVHETTVETYIIDCNMMLYDREVELYFCRKMRNQITFMSPESLRKQIDQDVQDIKAYLQTQKCMIL